MNQENYLNYAVARFNGKDVLCFALDGNFASRAWKESDEAFSQIVGRGFQFLSGDDGRKYCNDKGDFRRVSSDEEMLKLWNESHQLFRVFAQYEEEGELNWKQQRELSDLEDVAANMLNKVAIETLVEYIHECIKEAANSDR